MPVMQISLSGSCYSTVALTMERYISVCMPFFKTRHNLKAWMFLVPVFLFVTLYGSPRFFEFRSSVQTQTTCTQVS